MNPDTLTKRQINKLIDAAEADKKDLLKLVPATGSRRKKVEIRMQIDNRDTIISRLNKLYSKLPAENDAQNC